MLASRAEATWGATSSLDSIAASATIIALAAPTFAQSTDALAEAREKFAEARKLENSGEWAGALDLFQVVAGVKTTPQVRFHVALCMEHLGLLTQALDGFARAAEEADPSAPEVLRESRAHLKELETRIATVTVAVSGALPEDELALDWRPIPIGDRPIPVRLDPGTHVAEVRRGTAVVARAVFVAEAQKPKRVALTVGTVATSLGEPDALASAQSRDAGTPPARGNETGTSTQRMVGFGLLGLGGVSAVMTGVFAGMRGGALSDLEARCPAQPTCPAISDRDAIDGIVSRGKTYAALVNAFAGVTAAAVIGGFALVVTAPSRATAPGAHTGHAVSIRPVVSATSGGFTVEGVL